MAYFLYSESTPIRAGVKRSANEEEGEGLGEVVCTMNDVIMIEDGLCASGTVLKVGCVALFILKVSIVNMPVKYKYWSCCLCICYCGIKINTYLIKAIRSSAEQASCSLTL